MNVPPIVRRLVGWPILKLRMQTWQTFTAATKDPERMQQKKLQAVLREIAGSDFARSLQLIPGMSQDQFRNAVEVSGYDRMQPWIDRVLTGDRNALFSGESRLKMFAMTSGTTGNCKYIPVTQTSFEEYRRSWTVWGCGVARDWPLIPYGGVLNFASAPFAKSTPGGIGAGSISGMLFRAMHYTMRFTHAVPPVVADVEDTDLRIYLALRLALQRQDTRMLTTANPSTLISVARRLNSWREDLLKDLKDGSLRSEDRYPRDAFGKIAPLLRTKHPDLVRKIESRSKDGLTPRAAWPELELLGVWTGGTLAAYLPQVKELYGHDIGLRDHGLSASEARMTIPFSDHSPSGVLNIDGGFFEFIPVHEYERGSRTTLMPWELKENGDYYIILSTTGGLVRYDISDVVRCTGFYNRTPVLAFLNKGSQIGNLTGEKLSAWQVTTGMSRWFSASASGSFEYTVVPHFSKSPGYVVILEKDVAARLPSLTSFLTFVDNEWKDLNMEYDEKRRSNRLAALRIAVVEKGFFQTMKQERMRLQGGTFEQYKHPFFTTDTQILQRAGFAGTAEEQCS